MLPPLFMQFTLGVSVFLGLLIAFVIWRSLTRRRQARNRTLETQPTCPCGRCPECGRLIGFDKTPADLGISEDEMRAHAARKCPAPPAESPPQKTK